MAKLSMKARENRRIIAASKAKVKREALKVTIKSLTVSYEDKMAAVRKLSLSPRDESPVRIRTRCAICGRPRAVYRKFGLCRIHLREAVMRGDVPGIVKASW